MSTRKFFFFVVIFFLVSSFFSCKENNEYKGIVIVTIMDADGSNAEPVGNCELIFGKEHYAEDIKRVDYTDANGRYEGIWNKPVVLDVKATKEINSVIYSGTTSMRVELQGAKPAEIIFKR